MSGKVSANNKATEIARKRYDRVAPFYDLMESLIERYGYNNWRQLLWSKVEGNRILEIGVGIGKNFPFYPQSAEMTAIDLSEKMISRARDRAKIYKVKVSLHKMDVQKLEFNDNTFDTVLDSFVFCSVPDPILGLKEVKRVCRPGGKIILLEHVLSANRILALFMKLPKRPNLLTGRRKRHLYH